MMLCDRLIAHFVHHSCLSTAIAEVCSAMVAVDVDPRHRCFSGLALCSNVFVVSY